MENSFIELIKSSGCEYSESQKIFVFTVESSIFQRQLKLKLKSHANYPGNIPTFCEDFQEYTSDIASFRQCLLSAALSTDVPRNNTSLSVDSLLKNLLAIDILQPTIITYLLERLPEFYDELEHNQSSSCTARLILHQLRWLDYIVEPQQLTNTLIEIIQITPNVIQHEIITYLPDILNDTEHKPIVIFLKEWMQQHADLAVPILDALSNLSLHAEYLEDVRETVLERLQSAEIDDLAVIIKFILQTVTPHTIDTTIMDIRQNLDLRALGKVEQINATSQRPEQSGPSPEALILDSIKLGLQFHKFVCDAWVKALVALETQRAHKVIDVLVIFILCSMTSMKKKTEQILRKKIQSGLITPTLLKETLLCHANGLSGYWPSILSLSENLLRASRQQSALARGARALYIHSFRACDTYNRQELIGALVTHIGSGTSVEMDVALDVLLVLVENNVSMVAVYSVFIKGILDYLDNLTLPQTRTLFDIFSNLALKANGHTNDSSLWSDIQIVLRKQLSNPRVKYKRIGIIGSLSAVKVLGDHAMCSESAGSSSQSAISAESISRHPLLQQAVSLLELTLKSCSAYPTCISMIYDELANILEAANLDPRLSTWITEAMTSEFIDDYVMDDDSYVALDNRLANDTNVGMKPKLVMDFNGESAAIYMKFFSLLHGTNDKRRRKQIIPLCSMFNLLQSCEKVCEGSLEGVDALLGCGVILFNLDNFEELIHDWQTDEAEDACQMVFMTINWFRELLNCFSVVSEDEDIHRKLIQRLTAILRLESILETLLPKVPTFAPLHLLPTLAQYAEGKENRFASSQITQSNTQRTDDSDSERTLKTYSRFDTMESLRPHLRPLKIQVLAILKAPDQGPDSKFTYKECNYILQDINRKMIARLAPVVVGVGKKRKSGNDDMGEYIDDKALTRLSKYQLVEEMIKHIPKVLQVLETVNEDLQSDSTQYGRIAEDSKAIVTCSSLIFSIIYKLFAWTDIDTPDNQDLLMGLITALSDRMTDDASQFSTINKFKGAMRYLSGFHENIPQLQTAVTLLKLQERIMVLSGNNDVLRSDVCRAASEILSQNWLDWRDSKKDIPFLLEKEIGLNDHPLRVLVNYVNIVLPAFEKGETLDSFPLLKPETTVSYYQTVLNQTIKCVDLLEKTDQDVDVVLVQTSQVVTIFERITSYVKLKEQRALFGILLKASRIFIEQFTKHSIPFFSRVFKDHRDAIVNTFKQLQIATRLLQTICSHVKVIKDIQLSSYVPPLKKALEVVIYQVKMLLMENNAPADVFYLGSLKHRDISGAQVSSQLPKEIASDSEADLTDGDSSSSPVPRSSTSKSTTNLSKTKSRPKGKSNESAVVYRTPSQVPSSSDEDERIDIASDGSANSDDDDNTAPRTFSQNRKAKSISTGVMALDYEAFNNLLDQNTQNESPFDPVTTLSSDEDDGIYGSANVQFDSDSNDDGNSTPTPTEKSMYNNGSNSTPSPKPSTKKPPHSKTGVKRGYGLGMTRKRSKH